MSYGPGMDLYQWDALQWGIGSFKNSGILFGVWDLVLGSWVLTSTGTRVVTWVIWLAEVTFHAFEQIFESGEIWPTTLFLCTVLLSSHALSVSIHRTAFPPSGSFLCTPMLTASHCLRSTVIIPAYQAESSVFLYSAHSLCDSDQESESWSSLAQLCTTSRKRCASDVIIFLCSFYVFFPAVDP